MIVLDTNVLSEFVKPLPSNIVVNWLAEQERSSVFTTTITQAEVLYGIERLPPGKRRTQFTVAAEKMFTEQFEDRILPFDQLAARAFARIAAGRNAMGRPYSRFDAMIAAIARSQGAAVATRNTADFEHCGIEVINPWKE